MSVRWHGFLAGAGMVGFVVLASGTASAQALRWDPVTGAEAYRIYWSSSPASWPSCQYATTASTESAEVAPTPAPGKTTFYNVVAVAPSVFRYGDWDPGILVACTSPAAAAEEPPPPPQIQVNPDAQLGPGAK